MEIQCDSDTCHGFNSLVAIRGIKASKRPAPVAVWNASVVPFPFYDRM
jgi:hypothetical protein